MAIVASPSAKIFWTFVTYLCAAAKRKTVGFVGREQVRRLPSVGQPLVEVTHDRGEAGCGGATGLGGSVNR